MRPANHRHGAPRALLGATIAALLLVLALGGGTGAAAAGPAIGHANAGATLAATSDQVARDCPCAGPVTGGSWRSHGQYLSCVTRSTRRDARAALLTAGESRAIVRELARTTCGKGSSAPGNVRVCAPNPVLPCPTVRSAHVDDCSECDAALAGELVHCARIANAAGVQGDTCGTATRINALGKRAIEHRTGVDCASCKAKLGTPAGDGTDCLLAACSAPLSE